MGKKLVSHLVITQTKKRNTTRLAAFAKKKFALREFKALKKDATLSHVTLVKIIKTWPKEKNQKKAA